MWERKQSLELIRLYKAHPLLYQTNHPGNNNKIRREVAYVEIAEEMQNIRSGTTVREIKERIKNLRSQYHSHQKNSVDNNFITLWCQDYLRFLDEDFGTDKNSRQNFVSDPKEIDHKDNAVETVLDTDSIGTRESLYSSEQEEDLQSTFLEQEEYMLSNNELPMDDKYDDGCSFDLSENEYNESDISTNERILDCEKDISPNKFRHIEDYPTKSKGATYGTIDLTNSIVKINETLERTNILLNKLTYFKQSKNRPFVENLLLDLNKLPEEALRRTKWKITNIVCKAYLEEQKKNES